MPGQRDISVYGSFAEGVFLVDRISGTESLGEPFGYDLFLLSTSSEIDISTLVGDTMTVSIDLGEGQIRYFNGYVTRASLAGIFGEYSRYRVTLRPWLWLLSSRQNSRIFQNQSVPDIAKTLFREHGFSDFEDQLADTYAASEFVVQYQESDFSFVSRILEHAGIYYYFRHAVDRHVLVLADASAAHETVDGYEEVPFHPEGIPSASSDESLNRWELVHQWRPGAYASDDFDFERPQADLSAQLQADARHKNGNIEMYDYPAGYTKVGDVETYVRGRLEALQSDVEIVHGSGDVRGIGAGNVFSLIDFPNDSQNKEYLITLAAYEAANNAHQSGNDGSESHFQFSLTAIDSSVPFRPPLSTPRPRVQGPQTAVVVGKTGEEIWTDKYGRVKVQFRWDREGKDDENSSCWVRVAQVWAGSGWGAIHIPRIGQEVIVDFLEGDPDRPIITGRVYNADNMPPYALPDSQTQSGIKSRSSKGGGASNFNEIRFEDKKGSEELHIQAEKDETKLVKNNQSASIGADRSLSVGGNETVSIGKNRTETVGTDESVTIGSNQTLKVGANRTKTVGGSETVSIGASESVTIAVASIENIGAARSLTIGAAYQVSVGGAMSETVSATSSEDVGGNKSSNVGGSLSESVGADMSTSAGGGATISAGKAIALTAGTDFNVQAGKTITLEAADQLTITCGDATIVLKKSGDITVNGAKVQVTASGDLVLKGSKIAGN
jgi:type VI secretion system secreted protein VgrG